MNEDKKRKPPRWIDHFLRWRLPSAQFEEVQGDMHELYGQWVEEMGRKKANRLYLLNALTFLRPLPEQANSPKHIYPYSQTNSPDMIYNYLKTAFRNLLRNKAHSLINIGGLALGIACCLAIFLVVRYELSFDNFHSKANRIYRVNTKFITTGGFSAGAPVPMAEALKRDFPEIEQATTIDYANEQLLKVGKQLYKQRGVVYAAPEYFSMLDANWLSGNATTALAEPNTVVLTKSVARKLFKGDAASIAQRALGKIIEYENKYTLKVTGVIEDFPSNTDLPFEVFVSFKTFASNYDFTNWIRFSGSYTHFVLLREGADPATLQRKLPAFEKKYMGDVEAGRRTHLLQPLREMHFDDRFGNHNARVVARENLIGLILIGSFILLTACINFINLSTAQSIKRSKEVGVRKVLGANRGVLVWQFLTETSLMSLTATLLATVLTYLLLPDLKTLLDLQLNFNPFKDPALLLFLALITIVVSLLAGLYPAFILSGFQPIIALKNKITAPRSSTFSLRRSLIVLQFVIAQVLIICTLVVSSQLEFFRNQPLGFTKDAIITIPFPSENNPQTSRALRNQLEKIPGIEKLTYAVFSPSSPGGWWSTMSFEGADPTKEYYVQEFPVDHTYLQTFGLSLLAGKNFDLATDSSYVIVNEKLLETLNIQNPEEAIGRSIDWNGGKRQIYGVVKDFHTGSLKYGIPNIVMHRGTAVGMAGIKLSPVNMRKTIAQIEKLWSKTFPESLFEFTFLDERVADLYKEEVRLFKLFRLFSAIAIFISCLGVYGLISFMALQRNKEIGIRKVLGASAAGIVMLLSKEFIVLILIAFSMAAPLAWYAMHTWLQDFEYSLPISPASFLIAILFSLFIAGITVVYRSMRAALANPVKSLRSE